MRNPIKYFFFDEINNSNKLNISPKPINNSEMILF
jgi:hypothetical protein